jgi:hypothetical protein
MAVAHHLTIFLCAIQLANLSNMKATRRLECSGDMNIDKFIDLIYVYEAVHIIQAASRVPAG